MAAPLTKRQTQRHIDSIQTSKLLNRLQDYVFNGEGLDADRGSKALSLIDRVIPKLQAVEQTIDVAEGAKISISLGD
jgi:hypothetical protein